jgi:hypothetical protein
LEDWVFACGFFAIEVVVHSIESVHGVLHGVGLLRGGFGQFFHIATELRGRGHGQGLGLEMGRVVAGFDFAEVLDGKLDGFAAAELFGAFPRFQGGPNGGGELVAQLVVEGFGAVGLDFFTGELPAFGFDFEAGGDLIAAGEFDDGLAGAAQGAELAEGGFVELRALGGENGGVTVADGGGEMVGEGLALRDGLEIVPGGSQFAGMGEDVLAEEPFFEAALTPVGEVLLVDGLSVEALEDGFDLGQGVEPEDDLFAFVAVLEADVELGANIPREAGNFTDACHIEFSFFRCCHCCHGSCFHFPL